MDRFSLLGQNPIRYLVNRSLFDTVEAVISERAARVTVGLAAIDTDQLLAWRIIETVDYLLYL